MTADATSSAIALFICAERRVALDRAVAETAIKPDPITNRRAGRLTCAVVLGRRFDNFDLDVLVRIAAAGTKLEPVTNLAGDFLYGRLARFGARLNFADIRRYVTGGPPARWPLFEGGKKLHLPILVKMRSRAAPCQLACGL